MRRLQGRLRSEHGQTQHVCCVSPAPGSRPQTRSRWPTQRPARPRRRPRRLAAPHQRPRPQTLGAPAPGRLRCKSRAQARKGQVLPRRPRHARTHAAAHPPYPQAWKGGRCQGGAGIRGYAAAHMRRQNDPTSCEDIRQGRRARCARSARGWHTHKLCMEAPCASSGPPGPLASSKQAAGHESGAPPRARRALPRAAAAAARRCAARSARTT